MEEAKSFRDFIGSPRSFMPFHFVSSLITFQILIANPSQVPLPFQKVLSALIQWLAVSTTKSRWWSLLGTHPILELSMHRSYALIYSGISHAYNLKVENFQNMPRQTEVQQHFGHVLNIGPCNFRLILYLDLLSFLQASMSILIYPCHDTSGFHKVDYMHASSTISCISAHPRPSLNRLVVTLLSQCWSHIHFIFQELTPAQLVLKLTFN